MSQNFNDPEYKRLEALRIQACRQADRDMVATPAGAEMIGKVVDALNADQQSSAKDALPDGAREAFEKWAREAGFAMALDDAGNYLWDPTKNIWRAWQAALLTRQAVPEGWKLLKDSSHGERSFQEDSQRGDGGMYFNDCFNCGRTFTSRKGRLSCKVCTAVQSKEGE